MKKTLMFFAAILMITGLYAQSVQWHQSYDNNQKFVADFFWSNEKFNVYSYNELTVSKNQAVGYGIIYGEYRIAKSHFLTHLEARFRTRDFNGNIPSAMYYPDNNLTNIGFAGTDSVILTSFCKQYQKYGRLSEKQMEIILKKIGKYAGQLTRHAIENGLYVKEGKVWVVAK